MHISYNKLWKMLIDKKMNKRDLKDVSGVSTASIAKLSKGENITTDVVGVGTKVTLQDMKRGDVVQYAIVGSSEADPGAHKLSNESPVGRAILGRKPGDKVTVAVPQGSKKFKVLDIEKA